MSNRSKIDEYHDEMFKEFSNCRYDGLFCDVKMKIKNKHFHAHKVLLASASKYFKALFTADMKEKLQDVIEFKEMSIATFEACLNFIYDGKVYIMQDNVEDILHAACLFQLWRLKDDCVEFMTRNLAVHNCMGFLGLSRKYSCECFEQKVISFIQKNIETVLCKSDEIGRMDYDFIEKYLKSEDETFSDEVLLYEALVKWVNHDPENRKHQFCDLLQLVRLPWIPRTYLSEVVGNPLVKKCSVCNDYAVQSMVFQLVRENGKLTEIQKRKRGTRDRIVIYENKSFHVYEICSPPDRLFKVNTINADNVVVVNKSVCVVDGNLFVVGSPNSTEVFNCSLQSSEWIAKAAIPKVVGAAVNDYWTTLAIEKHIFVIGGFVGESFKSVYRYDYEYNNWHTMPDLLEGRQNASAAVLGGNIYVFGGRRMINGALSNLKSVERLEYNNDDANWVNVKQMLQPRVNGKAVAYRKDIYLIDGEIDNRDKSMDIYNEARDGWTNVPSKMTINRDPNQYDVVVVSDRILVFGGNAEDTNLEEWHVEEKKWKISDLKIDRAYKNCRTLVV